MWIIGCGYVGIRVAARYLPEVPVTGVVRSPFSLETLAQDGIRGIEADLDRGGELPALAGERVFYFAPPPCEGRTDSRMARFLERCSPERIVYISTTGVYGDCGGEWVEETRPANPQADRAWRRWDAEQQLQHWRKATGGEVVILRVAGIYGPGKLPLGRLKRGLPLVRESEAPYTNRIHVDDLVQVCAAAMEKGGNGEVYHACDGQPGNMVEYFNAVADATGLPRPPQIAMAEAHGELSAGMMSYMEESRRLSNEKTRRELGVVFRYPDLASGLAASL